MFVLGLNTGGHQLLGNGPIGLEIEVKDLQPGSEALGTLPTVHQYSDYPEEKKRVFILQKDLPLQEGWAPLL